MSVQPIGGVARPATFVDGLAVIRRGVRDQPGLFIGSVVGSVVFAAGLAGSGWALGVVTDSYLVPAYEAGGADTRQVTLATLTLAGVAVMTTLGVVVRRLSATVLTFRLQAGYRREVSDRLHELPPAWHRRHPAGQLLSIANSDAEAAFAVFAPLPYAIGTLVIIVIAGGLMLAADWVLALVALTAIPLLFAANLVYQRHMSARVAAAQQARADVSDVAHESFDGAVTVRALGAERVEAARFDAPTHRLRDANIAVGRGRSLFEPVIELLPSLAGLAVLAVGTVRVSQGSAGVADVVQVAYLLAILAFPIRAVGWTLAELPRSVIGWRRVSGVLDAAGDMPMGLQAAPTGRGPITLRTRAMDVEVLDPDGSVHPLLHRVDVEAGAGQVVAVVGATGAGKSTLLSALVRLVDPVAGSVELADVDAREFAAGEVAELVGYVPQTVFVFDDSIRDNVTLGRVLPPADGDAAGMGGPDSAVWAALEVARLADVVRALPQGLDTVVGERGATLSGGQRQRLGIARAVATRPRALVLDDATSALDATVEARVLGGLRHAWPVTVLVVAYRLSTIHLADTVVHLAGGRVAGTGTHETLLAADPGYRTLVQAYARQAAERAAERAVGLPPEDLAPTSNGHGKP